MRNFREKGFRIGRTDANGKYEMQTLLQEQKWVSV